MVPKIECKQTDGRTFAQRRLHYLTRYDDDDMTILMCAQKLTDASLIYRTEQETKNRKEKNKNKNGYRVCSEEAESARNRGVSPEGGKGRLGWNAVGNKLCLQHNENSCLAGVVLRDSLVCSFRTFYYALSAVYFANSRFGVFTICQCMFELLPLLSMTYLDV